MAVVARHGQARRGTARHGRNGTYRKDEEMTDEEPRSSLPEDVQDALDRVAKNDGRVIQPPGFEAAEDPESPLHKYFDWDDATAAYQHG
jgi:hypothetical protein